jgi:hypothetical protein
MGCSGGRGGLVTEDRIPYSTLTPRQLTTARLRAAHNYLSDVAQEADLLPEAVRHHVAQALAHVMEARAAGAAGDAR